MCFCVRVCVYIDFFFCQNLETTIYRQMFALFIIVDRDGGKYSAENPPIEG